MKKSYKNYLSILLCLFITIIMAFSVSASAKITVETVNDHIEDLDSGYAEFKIHVKNTGLEQETYTLWNLDPPSWFAQALPSNIYKEQMLASGETGEFHVLVRSSNLEKYIGKAIIVTAFIREASNPSKPYKAPMRIVIGPTTTKISEPEFDVDVTVPSQMDPRNSYNIIVDINNKNKRNLQNVSVRLSSKLINEFTLVDVGPEDAKSASFAVLLFDNIEPQSDVMRVTVEYGGKVFYDQEHNFDVVEYLSPFDKEIQVERKFFRENRVIRVTNNGNTKRSDVIKLEASLKDRIFSSSNPSFEYVNEDGISYILWNVELSPEESTEIILITSYRWLLIIVFLLVLFLVYRISMNNPLIVKKKFQNVHKEHKGAISDVSVVIYIKNKSNNSLTGLRVIERVSKMVKLKHDSFEGSMHPSKMHSNGKNGTLLEYRFAELGPGDERIIRYKVYSRLHIFGSLIIKPTVIEFKTISGKKKSSKSREISISAGDKLPELKIMKQTPKEVHHPGPPEGAEAAEEDIEMVAEDFENLDDVEKDMGLK